MATGVYPLRIFDKSVVLRVACCQIVMRNLAAIPFRTLGFDVDRAKQALIGLVLAVHSLRRCK